MTLFDDIGGKIKTLALILFGFGVAASLIFSIILIVESGSASGLILFIAGPILSWISSCTLYGFGELIEKVTAIEEKLNAPSSSAPPLESAGEPGKFLDAEEEEAG